MRKFTFLLFFMPALLWAQADCTLKKEKDGIKVFSCPPGSSGHKSIKASFDIKSTLSQLAAAVLDIDRLGDWQYETASARLIKKVNDREVIYHTEIKAPVVNNRDFVIRLTFHPDPASGGMLIDAVSIPDFIPPLEDVVRIPYSKAQWVVAPLSPGLLHVEYTIELDLGGNIPGWIVELLGPKAPYESFKALHAIIGRYEGRTVTFLKE